MKVVQPQPKVFIMGFPQNQMYLERCTRGSVEEIEKVTTESLRAIPSEEFQQWERRWAKCTALQGEYFKGDRIHDRDL